MSHGSHLLNELLTHTHTKNRVKKENLGLVTILISSENHKCAFESVPVDGNNYVEGKHFGILFMSVVNDTRRSAH